MGCGTPRALAPPASVNGSLKLENKKYMLRSIVFGWLTKDSEDSFSAKVDAGLKATTGNPNFTTLAAAVTACQTSYNTYLIAKANASQGGTDLISIRNTDRA